MVLAAVVSQDYETHVGQEYVIQGNDVILKCGFPSFVSDLLHIVSWEDDSGAVYYSQASKNGKKKGGDLRHTTRTYVGDFKNIFAKNGERIGKSYLFTQKIR
jgi:hypothetical protein